MPRKRKSLSNAPIPRVRQAELVFQRLLEAVEAHSSELATVKREVSTKAGGDELRG